MILLHRWKYLSLLCLLYVVFVIPASVPDVVILEESEKMRRLGRIVLTSSDEFETMFSIHVPVQCYHKNEARIQGYYNMFYYLSHGHHVCFSVRCKRSYEGLLECCDQTMTLSNKYGVTNKMLERNKVMAWLFDEVMWAGMRSVQADALHSVDISSAAPTRVTIQALLESSSASNFICGHSEAELGDIFPLPSRTGNGNGAPSAPSAAPIPAQIDVDTDFVWCTRRSFVDDSNDAIASFLVHTWTFENHISRAILREYASLARPHDGIFLDLGSNHGLFSVLALRMGFEVISVDPLRSNLEIMARSIQQTGLSVVNSKIHVYQAAVSDTRGGKFCVYTPSENQSDGILIDYHRRFSHQEHGKSISQQGCADIVHAVTVDSIMEEHAVAVAQRGKESKSKQPISILKVDIEGFDLYALRGSTSLLSDVDRAPCSILLEINPHLMEALPLPYKTADVFDFLAAYTYIGYDAITGEPFSGNTLHDLHETEEFRLSKLDVLFRRQVGGAHCSEDKA